MEMIIEGAIRDLIYLKGCGIFPFNYRTDAKQLTIATGECIAVAIDTMRKYQKIKEIMSELNGNFYGSYLKDRQVLEKIYEVIEDGNNN